MKQETLYITQNSLYAKELLVLDSYGDAFDLTNYEAEMHIAKYFGSQTKYAVSVTIQDPAAEGRLRINISSDGTAMLPYGTMQYSIFLRPIDGENTILLQGQVVVIPTV